MRLVIPRQRSSLRIKRNLAIDSNGTAFTNARFDLGGEMKAEQVPMAIGLNRFISHLIQREEGSSADAEFQAVIDEMRIAMKRASARARARLAEKGLLDDELRAQKSVRRSLNFHIRREDDKAA
jgi:hypothetical protein